MDTDITPRLRGVFHLYALFGALAAGIVLMILADGVRETLAAWVFGAALAAMFGASALYHRFPWKSAGRRLWARRLDHAMIFVFIAGAYTAFSLLALTGVLQGVVLTVVWCGAVFGLVLNLFWIDAPRWLAAIAYLGVGWVGVIVVPELFGELGVAVAVLLLVSGALYSLGALTYASTWPNPFPATFGFHEVFHLLVVAAAATQFVALSLAVL